MKTFAVIAAWLATAFFSISALAAAGDVHVYRVINRYNNETIGHVRQTDTPASTAQGQVLSVTVDTPALGVDRTEIYGAQGQWLRRPLDNHGRLTEYEFSNALPVVQPQSGTGHSWSARIPAKASGESRNRSVRIDGRVLGPERIRVPAGEFDTIRIQRTLYAGDADYFITETRIEEFDWYSPALGRSVRIETRSNWRDTRSGCRRSEHCDFRGDWLLYELTEVPAQAKP